MIVPFSGVTYHECRYGTEELTDFWSVAGLIEESVTLSIDYHLLQLAELLVVDPDPNHGSSYRRTWRKNKQICDLVIKPNTVGISF